MSLMSKLGDVSSKNKMVFRLVTVTIFVLLQPIIFFAVLLEGFKEMFIVIKDEIKETVVPIYKMMWYVIKHGERSPSDFEE